jgi:hypothetical protein
MRSLETDSLSTDHDQGAQGTAGLVLSQKIFSNEQKNLPLIRILPEIIRRALDDRKAPQSCGQPYPHTG